ncbi:MAG: D-glycero-alpha-D-manno-heptose-1,7-bisphosphate 7-phosphatase [Actinomycetota bacterium]
MGRPHRAAAAAPPAPRGLSTGSTRSSPGGSRRRFVILDRDGTIIEERGHLADPAGVALIPGSAAAIRRLRSLGLGLVVVTNQSVVGRGMVDQAGLEAIHERMRSLLEAEGASVDGVYHCPHLPEAGCACRKPSPELVERAARDLDFDPGASFVVGDHASDVEMGRRVGATTLLVLTGHGASEGGGGADHVTADLAAAARVIENAVTASA